MSVAHVPSEIPRRPSPFLRTRSSPVLPPRAPSISSPTSSVLESLSLPVLVFEPSLRLYSINATGRHAFGMPDTVLDGRGLGPGGAEQFMWTSSLEGASPADKIRRELTRLATKRPAVSWSSDGVGSDNRGDKPVLELKSGSVGGLRWWAEVVVDTFTLPTADADRSSNFSGGIQGSQTPPTSFSSSADGNPFLKQRILHPQEWFTVTLIKSLGSTRSTSSFSRQLDTSSEHTPTLGSAGREIAFSTEDGSEGAWEHVVPVAAESDGRVPTRVPGIWPTPRPALPLRLSALPSPATPPLSSSGTGSSKLSSHASVLSHTSTSSATTSVSTASSVSNSLVPTDLPPATVVKVAKLVGMGISVTSAGLQLNNTSTSASTSPSIPPHLSISSTLLPLRSPRPTSLPPPLPPRSKPAPDATQLLLFAAVANLPNTGVIVADPDLSSGFINPLAREILMGIPAARSMSSPEGPSSPSASVSDDYWMAGSWGPEDGWSEQSSASTTTSNTSFFPGTSSHGGPDPFEAKDMTYAGIIAAGEAKFVEQTTGAGGSNIRLGNPADTNRYRTTVAKLLARSLASVEKQQGTPHFVAVGGSAGKKTYRIFDASFNQRIIDPLEPLLEICIRRGQKALTVEDDEGGVTSGMVVGIEVDVWDSGHLGKSLGAIELTARNSGRRKRVRRRLVEISASPIYEPTTTGGKGRHLGGVLVLRDVTDDSKRQVVQSTASTSLQKSSRRGEGFFKHVS